MTQFSNESHLTRPKRNGDRGTEPGPGAGERKTGATHTDDVTAKEGIDPAHDERIGDNHGHVVLHHAHHAVHGTRIGEGVGGRLALPVRVLEESARLEGGDEVVAAGLEGAAREDVEVVLDADAVEEGALLAHRGLLELLGGVGEEDGSVMAENTGQDLKGAVAHIGLLEKKGGKRKRKTEKT